jgi:hypothetical protein
MSLPLLFQQLYGEISFTGLYSFEFVDNFRNTVVEVFFMMPPKNKTTVENTRSTLTPTLGGNYLTDAGNSIKQVTLSGKLWFPHVGSPDNPLAITAAGLNKQIDGLTEFFKLQFMLIRYRDYTMEKNAAVTIPIAAMAKSSEIVALYKKVESLVNNKIGALYDQLRVIFHDYDMNDHYF